MEEVIKAAYPKASDDAEITALAVRHASALYRWVDRAQEADDVLLKAARVTDPACRRTIEAQRGGLFLRSGELLTAIELEAPLVHDRGDPAFIQASLNLGVALPLAGRGEEAIRHLDDLAATTGMDRTNPPAFWADTWTLARVYSLVETGRLADAYTEAQSAYDYAARPRPRHRAGLDGHLPRAGAGPPGRPPLGRGKAAGGKRLFRRDAPPGGAVGLPAWPMVAGMMGRAAVAEDAVRSLEAVDESGWAMMDVYEYRGRAWAAVAAGDLVTATGTLWELVAAAEKGGQLAALSTALHDLLRIQGGFEAASRLDQLEPLVEGVLDGRSGPLRAGRSCPRTRRWPERRPTCSSSAGRPPVRGRGGLAGAQARRRSVPAAPGRRGGAAGPGPGGPVRRRPDPAHRRHRDRRAAVGPRARSRCSPPKA